MSKKGSKTRGDSETRQYKNITVSVWQDTKPVVVTSSNSDPKATDTVQRKQKDGTRTDISSPTSISLYNRYMGGVDLNDQLRGYYHVRLKCRKYYKYIFWFIFDVAITNTYILCHYHTDLGVKSTKDLRVDLAQALIGDYSSRKRLGRPSRNPQPKRFCQHHFPTRGASTPHRCYYCHNFRHERHATVWYCKDCEFFLCHDGRENDCFYQLIKFYAFLLNILYLCIII